MDHKKPWHTRIDRHTSPMDTDRFWQQLQGKLEPDTRRRRFIIYWFVLAALCGTIFYFTGGHTTGEPGTGERAAIYPATQSGIPDTVAGEGWGDTSPAGESDHTTGTSASIRAGRDGRHRISGPDSPGLPHAPTGGIERPALDISDSMLPGTHPGQADELAGAVPESGGDATSIGMTGAEPGHPQAQVPVHPPIAGDTREEGGFLEHSPAAVYTGEQSQWDTAIAVSAPPIEPPARDQPTVASIAPGIDSGLHEPSQSIRSPTRTWRLWTDLSYGAGYAFHRFDTRDAEYLPYISLRRESETALESRIASWESRLVHPSGFYILSGLRYQTHVSRFDWQLDERRTAWGLADGFMPDGGGAPVPFRDSAWQHYRVIREIRQHNRLSSLSVPVAIGYARTRKSWSFEAAAGILVRFSHRSTGMSLGLDGSPVVWGERPELTYLDGVRIDATCMFRAGWYPARFLGVFVQPAFTYSPAGRLVREAGYTHRIHSAHLQLGMSFLLYGSR